VPLGQNSCAQIPIQRAISEPPAQERTPRPLLVIELCSYLDRGRNVCSTAQASPTTRHGFHASHQVAYSPLDVKIIPKATASPWHCMPTGRVGCPLQSTSDTDYEGEPQGRTLVAEPSGCLATVGTLLLGPGLADDKTRLSRQPPSRLQPA